MPATATDTRRWWVIGTLGCLAMLAVVVWFALSATLGRVRWQTVSYEVVDGANVTVTFTVHRPSDTAVTCRIKAMDPSFATVGILEIDIPAGASTTVTERVALRTTALATTGLVDQCSKT